MSLQLRNSDFNVPIDSERKSERTYLKFLYLLIYYTIVQYTPTKNRAYFTETFQDKFEKRFLNYAKLLDFPELKKFRENSTNSRNFKTISQKFCKFHLFRTNLSLGNLQFLPQLLFLYLPLLQL